MRRAFVAAALVACGGHTAPGVSTPRPEAPICGGDPVAKNADERTFRPHAMLASDLEGSPIAKVTLEGQISVSASEVSLRAGDRLTRENVARSIRALYTKGDVDDIEVTASNEANGVTVVFRVRERPFVAEIRAPGVPDATREEMAKALSLERGRRLDMAELIARRRDIDEAMNARGARFEVRVMPLKGNKVDVCILVAK